MLKLFQKPKKIVLYGAGGFGRELASLIEKINKSGRTPKYRLLGFIDDNENIIGKAVNGYPVLGNEEWLVNHRDEVVCTCAIGKSEIRKELQERLIDKGVKFETLIASGVSVHPTTSIGVGSVICGEVFLSVNVTIGDGVVINCRTNIGHDATVGDYSCIMSACNITGNVTVGSCVDIGGAAYIIPGRKIGDNSLIAAGSVVFGNVRQGTKVLGNPAKKVDI